MGDSSNTLGVTLGSHCKNPIAGLATEVNNAANRLANGLGCRCFFDGMLPSLDVFSRNKAKRSCSCCKRQDSCTRKGCVFDVANNKVGINFGGDCRDPVSGALNAASSAAAGLWDRIK